MATLVGQTVSHYKILKLIGEGGMGIVYEARDLVLDRVVAMKFLPPDLTRDPVAKQRFVHEAKAASALQHNNICTIHDIGDTESSDEAGGHLFIVMDRYEGELLKDKIARGPIPVHESIAITMQIASGLANAHERGIVHRDIKPANIFVTSDGTVKVLDFGLAKLAGVHTRFTKAGSTLGTVAYMSPEQSVGEDVDSRTDVWSLGVVLYEMLTGKLPFKGEHEQAVIYLINNQAPEPLERQVKFLPPEVVQIVHRALEKRPDARYSSAARLLKDLKAYHDKIGLAPKGGPGFRAFLHAFRKPVIAVPAAAAVVGLILLASWFFDHQSKIRWARAEALPEIEKMIGANDLWRNLVPPYRLAQKAEAILGNDPTLTELFSKCALHVDVKTEPPGAKVYIQQFSEPKADWEYLGETPLQKIRLPIGIFRWKLEKEGYETVLAAASTWNADISNPDVVIPCEIVRILDAKQTIPAGMVRVSGTETPVGKLGDFFIDRFEVTNRQYKEFVDKGGYTHPEYWKHKFLRGARELTWEEAMRIFTDQTGQPGPSTWRAGDYPDGQDAYPVAGVSWYEAAAFAEFSEKSLPTGYHWGVARGEYTPMVLFPQLGGFAILAPFSNFMGEGPVATGSLPGVSAYGAFDMAGNVREWCSNETPQGRLIRGGAWGENTYMYDAWSQAPATDRSAKNGFRCAVYPDRKALPEQAFQKATLVGFPALGGLIQWEGFKPVGEDVFRIYSERYSYDKTDLQARVESRKEGPDWVLEKVSFNPAYSGDRVIGWLFLPRNVAPPFQTVIYWGGDAPVFLHSMPDIEAYYEVWMFFSFLVKNGRAVFYPVVEGFFERGNDRLASIIETDMSTHQWSEVYTHQVKDLRRSIDYLETRPDIDRRKVAYYGMSYGSCLSPPVLAVENRFVTNVLLAGGYLGQGGMPLPDVNPANYIGRVKTPTLMLNGRYDSILPLETSVRPMFRQLGAPAEHKQLKIYETDHIPPMNETIRETLTWLDRHMGPVR